VLAYERKHLVWSALGGAIATAGVTLVVRNLDAILSTAHVWVTVLVLPVAGITLFWFRARQRLAYGITELGVGLVAARSRGRASNAAPRWSVRNGTRTRQHRNRPAGYFVGHTAAKVVWRAMRLDDPALSGVTTAGNRRLARAAYYVDNVLKALRLQNCP
jgi:hypothetical protein